MEWKIEYENDTGNNDESYYEWWNVTNGDKYFRCKTEEDANFLLAQLSLQQESDAKDAFDKFSDSCTKEEIASETYLEWSDERLGQAARALADRLKKTDVTGFKGIMTMAASYALLDLAVSANSFTTKLSFDGYTNKKHPKYGEMSATIVVKLKSKPSPPNT